MFRRSAELPHRGELAEFTDILESEIRRLGVAIELGRAPEPAELQSYDEVVVATGASRNDPDPAEWPDTAIRVIGLEEALTTGVSSLDKVVILDRGDHHNVGILLALKFAGQGAASIDVLDPVGAAAGNLDALTRIWLSRDFEALRIRLASNVQKLEVAEDKVRFAHDGWEQSIDSVSVIVVLEAPHAADRSAWPESAIFLGDADAPGLGVEIVHHAYVTALEI
jgi:hypothetical protein